MRYVNLRIEEQMLKDGKLVDAAVLQGQRVDTLNWETIAYGDDLDLIKYMGKQLLQNPEVDEHASLFFRGYGI